MSSVRDLEAIHHHFACCLNLQNLTDLNGLFLSLNFTTTCSFCIWRPLLPLFQSLSRTLRVVVVPDAQPALKTFPQIVSEVQDGKDAWRLSKELSTLLPLSSLSIWLSSNTNTINSVIIRSPDLCCRQCTWNANEMDLEKVKINDTSMPTVTTNLITS